MLGKALTIATAGNAGAEADEYFNQTTLLLHGDGTNGAQNNTFLDSSTNNFTITRNGNTTQGTFSPFSSEAGKWSGFFDDVDDYLSLAKSSDFAFAGDFTIEFWYWNDGGNGIPFSTADNGNYTTGGFAIEIVSGNFRSWIGGAQTLFAPLYNGWHHFALSRESGTCRAFHDGVLEITFSNSTTITQTGTNTPLIGARRTGASGTGSPGDFWDGWLSNLSILNGTAKYTSAFTPSTTPLSSSETNQVLLACTANRFVDANTATTAKTITPNGGAATQPFSAFAPTAAYDASVNGGSGYFDGTGDYLTSPSVASLSGDFTMEFWIYPTVAANGGICGIGNYTTTTGLCLYQRVNRVSIFINNTESSIGATGLLLNNSFNHVALVRSSGVFKIYTNGVAGTTLSNSATFNDTLYVNAIYGGTVSARPNPTYVSDFRIETSAVYTSDFTPPTAPADPTGSSICLSMVNAGIFDNTGKNNLETVGNVQLDTATKVFGTGSLEFDGSGDYLLVPNNGQFVLGNTATIEFWVRQISRGANLRILYTINNLSGIDCYVDTNGLLRTHGSLINSTYTVPLNTWVYVALVYNAGTLTIYVNGTSYGTGSGVNITSTNPMYIGSLAAGYYWNGFIDDLRITRGVARYTSAFTPPTAPFPDQ